MRLVVSSPPDLPKYSTSGTQLHVSFSLIRNLVLGAGSCVGHLLDKGFESSPRRVRALIGCAGSCDVSESRDGGSSLSQGRLEEAAVLFLVRVGAGLPRTWKHRREGAGLEGPAVRSRERAEVLCEETPSEHCHLGAVGPWVNHLISLSSEVTCSLCNHG